MFSKRFDVVERLCFGSLEVFSSALHLDKCRTGGQRVDKPMLPGGCTPGSLLVHRSRAATNTKAGKQPSNRLLRLPLLVAFSLAPVSHKGSGTSPDIGENKRLRQGGSEWLVG